MEQPLFAPGDRVVCVDSKGNLTGLVEGTEYSVIATKRSKCCGHVLIDVGIQNQNGRQRCSKCSGITLSIIGWRRQTRFVPVDFDRYADNELHQALKGIPETL
jgi:hypothetical protein